MTTNEKNITERKLKDWNQGKTNFAIIDAAQITESFEYNNYSEEDASESIQRYIDLEPDVFNWLKSRGLAPQQYVNELLHQQMQQPR